jgi:hypothetical protein
MIITREFLASVKRRAFRKRDWFRVLDPAERAVLSLTIKCVKRVKSAKLAKIVTAIVEKLENAMKSKVERLMETVGSPLAFRLSMIALGWGNPSASWWAHDCDFVRFLAVNYMNTPDGYRGAG